MPSGMQTMEVDMDMMIMMDTMNTDMIVVMMIMMDMDITKNYKWWMVNDKLSNEGQDLNL